MIMLTVCYEAKTGKRDAFYNAVCSARIPELTRHEDGCERYDYYFPVAAGDEILLIEYWRDEASLAAHHASEHFAQLGALKDRYVDNTTIERFERP